MLYKILYKNKGLILKQRQTRTANPKGKRPYATTRLKISDSASYNKMTKILFQNSWKTKDTRLNLGSPQRKIYTSG